jgi:putative ABC transport system permease protein
MSSFGAVRTASGGLLRHKVQAIVIGFVLLISTASATIGFALLAATSTPFNHAFATQRGSDVALTVNTARATAAQLAASGKAAGVTAVAGPFPVVQGADVQIDGQPFPPVQFTGRAAPGGPVDDLVLNSGHWLTGPGQVVLGGGVQGPQIGAHLGSVITVGSQKLAVVGFANSVTNTAFGWVTPAEAGTLRAAGVQAAGTPETAQMLYRFASAATYAQVRADITAVEKTLPAGTVTDNASWLTAQQNSEGNGAIMEPFVVAFAVIGLVMAVLIVGNVVSGAVAAQYHRIGVLKSLGMTPRQVVTVYLGRIGLPALVGVVIGVVAGDLLSVPLLSDSARAYGVGSQHTPWWALMAAPVGMLALTLLAAFAPALRAGRLSATAAIAAGRAPRAGRGYLVHRIASTLRLPRPVGIGLASPFARPGRTLVSLLAIAFGATAVIFAFGLTVGLGRAQQASNHTDTAPVQVYTQAPGQGGGNGAPVKKFSPGSGPPVPTTAQFAELTSSLNAQPGTARYVAEYGDQVKVADVSQPVQAQVFGGDASWMGFGIIAGHWYDKPGEADVNTAFLTQSGLSVGDTATVTIGGQSDGRQAAEGVAPTPARTVTVKIAGEVFAPDSTPHMFAAAATLPGVATAANLGQYDVGLKPGTSVDGYVQGLNSRLGSNGIWLAQGPDGGGGFYTIALALIGLLALMVAVAAGLGVLNTVLMTTRDKVHDMGVFKALGMRPGQTLTMVVCQVIPPAVIAGAIAAPAAVALTTATIRAMGGTAHTGIPPSFTDVFPPSRLALLSLAALIIAIVGALLPASWAARSRPATALRAE